METTSDPLDCRGLTPDLAAVRIKQAVSVGSADAAPLPVLLDEDCAPERVSGALQGTARRVRYVPAARARRTPPNGGPSLEGTGPAPRGGAPWWQRPDLRYTGGRLHLGGTDIDTLASRTGTPAYVLSADRVHENVRRLSAAMAAAGLDHRIYYAVKANRTPGLLAHLRTVGACGVDVCSVGELMHVQANGFPPEETSFTGTSLTGRDISVLARMPEVRVNPDSLASLDALGRACPGREVGLRINPGVGVGYQGDDRLNYSGGPATKFGVYADRFAEARDIAAQWGMRIVRLHCHVGCGYLDAQIPEWERALDGLAAAAECFPDLREVNIGGGLGVPHTASDRPLDLDRWAGAVARRFAGRGLHVAVEPGDYLVKDAGLLVTEVTGVERRRDVLFAGLDAGFNLAMEPAFYGLPCEPVATVPRWGEGEEVYTVAGDINEALDVWMSGHRMPRLRPGDRVALINSGGYAASMRSDHCLRGQAADVLLLERRPVELQ
ncbi:diaminopimelate decarboxylase [Nocardiopsis chromatogenes]|uniref:diaminopimelate decarboxylase n=1 Tax=Nocardiopsis chromatogenes TaxID=280239 RepID=UPI000345BEDE|nr:diaminopimelate decarboxylase [Nocardiopsis chromatogenes]